MYLLVNTFSSPERIISRHRNATAAGKADSQCQRAIKKANGKTCYLPTEIRREDGQALTETEVDQLNAWRR